jgi:hypothetical protein
VNLSLILLKRKEKKKKNPIIYKENKLNKLYFPECGIPGPLQAGDWR